MGSGIEKENGILDSHGIGVGMQVQDPLPDTV